MKNLFGKISDKVSGKDSKPVSGGSTSGSPVGKSPSPVRPSPIPTAPVSPSSSFSSAAPLASSTMQPSPSVSPSAPIPGVTSGASPNLAPWQQKIVDSAEKRAGMLDVTARYMLNFKHNPTGNDALDSARGPIVFGLWASLVTFLVLFVWGVLAPLDSAVVAIGTIMPESHKKTIQHLEGGIIKEILVKEGERVEKDQTLLVLDDTTAKARYEIVYNQLITARLTLTRLIAQRDNTEQMVIPEDILAKADQPNVKDIIDTQTRLFFSQRKSLEGEVSVLQQRIEQLTDEIDGLSAQEQSSREQLQFLNQEIDTVKKLVDKGQALKPRLLALQRQKAEVEGRRGEFLANIARARQTITEAELQIINAKNERLNTTVTELRDNQAQIADLTERLNAAQDMLVRTKVKAPDKGIVTGLKFFTVGGVISPGTDILNIVPEEEQLVIEAQLRPENIDEVQKGQSARVRLSAYKARVVPMLEGKVLDVSADKFVDQATNVAFYKAKIGIAAEEYQTYKDLLYIGMPAEVYIAGDERTFMGYLLSPITESFGRAFREQ